ncbi:hypothetical protein MGG_15749 [Pyricularia oryzae 70-15]|uniref:ML-like domain-containing protein n=3 Tax=Pyricularia oryzae TaxID=318829 RepID=G4MUE0_PYRO7|nr:uncharacterized protein MGG_15749 [Pyricularia oryzae 70-15]EHA54827.1 hypothetical protein MGG_15749 [Pyricularia oryzae 70-15]ELQ43283.1 DUF907 domain-containing protein [Pyricularia oryzae Y34]KAI7915602.1 hypothetical protein M9X92_008314 [Pyricularia oryzae]KAI7919703.1 hypothetical protein M0657_006939 [Pyricularia oryzae]
MARYGGGKGPWHRLAAGALGIIALALQGVAAEDILKTSGFSNCGTTATVEVKKMEITYNASNKTVVFDISGTSSKIQNVTASLDVTAYGQSVFSNKFNPCSAATFVSQLCPVPAGTFSARGSQVIPAQFADAVPAIAFQVPDIAALATLELKSLDSGSNVACIRSQVSNGKTANVPAVSYVAASVAGAALVMTGVSAMGAAVAGGSGAAAGGSAAGFGTVSPSFTEVFGWFQGLAMDGMLSVAYPQVYRSFSKNFAFSTGLVPWTQLQVAIDDFRGMTGGNLTADSVEALRNTTLVFDDGSIQAPHSNVVKVKRAFDDLVMLAARQIETSINTTAPASGQENSGMPDNLRTTVTGIQAYVNQLSIPSANTFMTVLLIVAIAIVAIAVGILLFKLILEFWALFGNFPKSLIGFREHYWGSIARAITSLILLLYGVWVLYCIFQFTHGDSWAAKTLAGVTLALFTGVLLFFSFKIWYTARQLKQAEGSASGLYDQKSIWVKYSMFYESYKKDYWWLFVPTIVYLFAKGVCIAMGDGHGRVQTISLLCIEAVMLAMLLWNRPYERKSGNIINVIIAVVRVLSVVVILVFVQEFGVTQTTQTVAGVVLIVIQSTLTGVLAILIAWNAIIACCKANPHRKRRKELEKMRDADTLTPLDARNSLLLDRPKTEGKDSSATFAVANTALDEKSALAPPRAMPERHLSPGPRSPYPSERQPAGSGDTFRADTFRPLTPQSQYDDKETLLGGAAPIGTAESRQPTLPALGGGYGAPRPTNNYNPSNYVPSDYGGGYGGGYNQGADYNNNGYGYGPRGGY